MILPEHISLCIEKLEAAGFEAYAVGGCVRDDFLGRIPHDFDLCTSALPEQTEAVFADYPLQLEGKQHGTVCVVTEAEVVEITTFRAEGPYSDNRHPDWVRFVTQVEADLARRDFTINAMAWSPTRGYADPFHGREDLEKGLLRTVGDPWQRFREDALRILRGVRFASRYGLSLEPETEKAMFALAPTLQNLAQERIYDELNRILPNLSAADMIRFVPVLTEAIPELRPMMGFDQRSPHHAYDLYTHVAHVVDKMPADLELRWAALLHDVGKVPTFTQDSTGRGHYYDHAKVGAEMASDILRRFRATTALRTRVVTLIRQHMTRLKPDRTELWYSLKELGWEMVRKCLTLQEADMSSKGVPNPKEQLRYHKVRRYLDQLEADNVCISIKELAVSGRDLMAMGYQGTAVGYKMRELLDLVMTEQVRNTKEALLARLEMEKGEN